MLASVAFWSIFVCLWLVSSCGCDDDCVLVSDNTMFVCLVFVVCLSVVCFLLFGVCFLVFLVWCLLFDCLIALSHIFVQLHLICERLMQTGSPFLPCLDLCACLWVCIC